MLLAQYDKARAKALVTFAHDGAKRIGLAAITKNVFAKADIIEGEDIRRQDAYGHSCCTRGPPLHPVVVRSRT